MITSNNNRIQTAALPLASVLCLNKSNIGSGFAIPVCLDDRDDDPTGLYCKDEASFHKKYFKFNFTYGEAGVCLCLLERSKDLWLLTKAIKRDSAGVNEAFKEFSGRLMINFHKKNHSGNINLQQQIDQMSVHSILDRPFSFLRFTEYGLVRLEFEELKKIVELQLSDWQNALSSIAAVYLITDSKHGGAYVGSAYGKEGLWGRWSCYASGDFAGSGGIRDLLTALVKMIVIPNISYSQS